MMENLQVNFLFVISMNMNVKNLVVRTEITTVGLILSDLNESLPNATIIVLAINNEPNIIQFASQLELSI